MQGTKRLIAVLSGVALAAACSSSGGSGGTTSSCTGSACGSSSASRSTTRGGSSGVQSSSSTTTSAATGSGSTGGSSTTPASSSAGSSSGSSSSGSSGAEDGGSKFLACPSGSTPQCAAPICAAVYDFALQSPEQGATLSLVQPDGVPVSGANSQATTLSDGSFFLCPPVGSPVFVQATASGYLTTDSAILVEPGGPDLFFVWLGPLGMLSASLVPAFEGALGTTFAPGSAMVVVTIQGSACGSAGYSIGAALPDGGTLADGGPLPFSVGYASGAFVDPSLTATTDGGAAFLYNIDPSLTNGAIAITITNPGATADCLVPLYTDADSTGLVPVSANSFSETILPLD